MEAHESLLLLLLAIGLVAGIVGSIIYYFARYGMGPEIGKEGERTAEVPVAPAPSAEPAAATVQPAEPLKDLDSALAKTKQSLWGRIRTALGAGQVPAALLESVEEILYTSDLGSPTVQRLMGALEQNLTVGDKGNEQRVHETLRQEMLSILGDVPAAPTVVEALAANAGEKPLVWLVVGVNGAGKTTTIGKLANQLAQSGKKVLLAAGDTFRAAAGEQLKVWTERAQVEIFAPAGVLDPAAVAFQAVQLAQAQAFDVVIIDTAGRLHTQKNLMEELKKVKRVLQKLLPSAPHQTLLVLDANSGQNALVQARQFNEALEITGVVLSKMDGTAKGGVALSLACELQLPVRLIGVGEGLNDLRPFAARDYVSAII